MLEALPQDDRLAVWQLVDGDREGDILVEVNDGVRETLIEAMNRDELVDAVETLDTDEIADLVEDLPPDVVAANGIDDLLCNLFVIHRDSRSLIIVTFE